MCVAAEHTPMLQGKALGKPCFGNLFSAQMHVRWPYEYSQPRFLEFALVLSRSNIKLETAFVSHTTLVRSLCTSQTLPLIKGLFNGKAPMKNEYAAIHCGRRKRHWRALLCNARSSAAGQLVSIHALHACYSPPYFCVVHTTTEGDK